MWLEIKFTTFPSHVSRMNNAMRDTIEIQKLIVIWNSSIGLVHRSLTSSEEGPKVLTDGSHARLSYSFDTGGFAVHF